MKYLVRYFMMILKDDFGNWFWKLILKIWYVIPLVVSVRVSADQMKNKKTKICEDMYYSKYATVGT